MSEIPYERLEALESALGGRAAINAAFAAGGVLLTKGDKGDTGATGPAGAAGAAGATGPAGAGLNPVAATQTTPTFTKGTGTDWHQGPTPSKIYFVTYVVAIAYNGSVGVSNIEVQASYSFAQGGGSPIWDEAFVSPADTGMANVSNNCIKDFNGCFFLPANFYYNLFDTSSAPAANYSIFGCVVNFVPLT